MTGSIGFIPFQLPFRLAVGTQPPASVPPAGVRINLPPDFRRALTNLLSGVTSENRDAFLDRINIIAEEFLNPSPNLTRVVDNMLEEIETDYLDLHRALVVFRGITGRNRDSAHIRQFFQQLLRQSPIRTQLGVIRALRPAQAPELHMALNGILNTIDTKNPVESEQVFNIIRVMADAYLTPRGSDFARRLKDEVDLLINEISTVIEENPTLPREERERYERQVSALRQLQDVVFSERGLGSQGVRNFFTAFKEANPQIHILRFMQGFQPGREQCERDFSEALREAVHDATTSVPRNDNQTFNVIARIGQMYLAPAARREQMASDVLAYINESEDPIRNRPIIRLLDIATANPNSPTLRQFFQTFLTLHPQTRQMEFLNRS